VPQGGARQGSESMPKRPGADRAAAPSASEPSTSERTVTVSFPVSETLHVELKVRAARERTTLRGLVMKGLKSLGLDVPETDLADRRPGRSGRAKEQ